MKYIEVTYKEYIDYINDHKLWHITTHNEVFAERFYASYNGEDFKAKEEHGIERQHYFIWVSENVETLRIVTSTINNKYIIGIDPYKKDSPIIIGTVSDDGIIKYNIKK